jgi:para-nitrobenzyl esterase
MHQRPARILVWVICLHLGCLGVAVAQSEQPQAVVKLDSGVLQGAHFSAEPSAVAFLGIPYAAPPTGDLRWKPPQPAPKWSGSRKATDFGAPCPQLPARWLPYIEGNEDCLYLNIWTTETRADAKRPVLVYFHGGGNTQGYSQMTPLGPLLSRLGLVVVSANYRLGPFGFLAHPALTAESEHHSSGNYGLLDQLQALKWVQENIRRFGGNPERVTVMGQSAGAVDICLLMVSPLSQGLFQGAILESGECQDTLNEDIRAPIRYKFIDTTGEASGERLAKDLGVPGTPDTLQRLRQTPANEILKVWKNDRGLHFDAIVDGWIIPRQPAQIFAEEKQMHIPILVGSNADEGTVFAHNDLKTVRDYKKHLQQDTGQYSNEQFQLYPVSSDADVHTGSVQLESDEFASGAYSIAQAMTQAGVKSYLYYFTYVDPGKRARLGAHHGEELFFLSESFPSDWEHTGKDEELGKLIRGYWVHFVKSGNPDFDSAPDWPPYNSQAPAYLELGEDVGLRPVSERIRALETIMRRIVVDQNR